MSIVFPLRPRGKEPVLGLHWADADDDAIMRAWAAAPDDANSGLRLDDLTVIDCDNAEAVALWERVGPPTPMQVETGRGRHFYYQRNLSLRSGPLVPGIDIKTGPRAYVVAEGSVHETGVIYTAVAEGDPAPLPDEAIAAVRPAVPATTGGSGGDFLAPGTRSTTLASLGGALRKGGADAHDIERYLLGIARHAGAIDADFTEGEVASIARSMERYEPSPEREIVLADTADTPLLVSARSLTLPPSPEWFWYPYLPCGRLVLLDGSEGIGKGTMCVSFAINVARGVYCQKRTVLWATAEDDPEEDILRRLLAAGYGGNDADVFFFTVNPKFPMHTGDLGWLIEQHNAGLVVLDPGRSFLCSPDGKPMSYNDEAAVRPGLESLNKIAKATGCTIPFVHHWNKNTEVGHGLRAGGSAAFTQVVRHRVSMAWVGDNETGSGAFEVTKSNIAPKGHLHGYKLVPHEQLQTAVFQPTEPLHGFRGLTDWAKKTDHEPAVELDPYESLEAAGVKPGDLLSGGRTALAKILGVGQNRAVEIIGEMKDEGGARNEGPRGTRYLGRPTL